MFAWLKRKAFEVVTPPPPMPIIPGEEYTMHVGNPFQDDPKARVVAVDKGWVQYQFVMGDALSSFQHTPEKYFRHCYKRIPPQSHRSSTTGDSK